MKRTINIRYIAIAFVGLLLWPMAFAQEAPLSFEDALSQALKSPNVILAQSQLELAKRQLAVASSLISAEISAGYSASWGELNAPSLSEPQSLDDSGFDPLTLNATLNVIPFGPNYERIQRARYGLTQAQKTLEDERTNAVIDVTQRYLTALRARQEEDVEALNVELALLELEAVSARLEVGAANEAQVLQAEIALSQAENDLATARRESVQVLASLSLALGMPLSAVAGEPPTSKTPELSTELALDRRSDVINARLAVAEAELNAASTLRENLPSGSFNIDYVSSSDTQSFSLGAGFDTRSFQPSLSSGLDFDYENPGAPPEASSQSLSLRLGLRIPLDVALSDALAAARLSVEQSQQREAQTLELAKLDIDNQQSSLQAAEAGLALAQKLLTQSEQAAKDAEQRFELGLTTVLDLKRAELSAAEAALNYDRSRDIVLLARLQLAKALAMNPFEVF